MTNLEYETTGEIYSFSKDKKSICILGNWYRSFTPITLFQKGDNVKLIVKDKKIGTKIYRNIISIERNSPETKSVRPAHHQPADLVKDIEPEWAKKIDSDYPNELNNTDKNCLLLCSKDLFIELHKDNKNVKFKDILEEVKRLRINL